jgi:hypothetical protein
LRLDYAGRQIKVYYLLLSCDGEILPPYITHRPRLPLDLQAILQLDPGHREAMELLPPAGGKMPAGIGNVSRVSLAGVLYGGAEFRF